MKSSHPVVWKGSQWAVQSLLCCPAQKQDALNLSRTDEPTVMLVPMSQSSILVLRKHPLWVIFILLEGFLLLQGEVWNRLINVNYLITKMIFRRNVKAQRFKINKLEKWLSYSIVTENAVPEEVENVKNLNAFHRIYLERINMSQNSLRLWTSSWKVSVERVC